MFEIKEDLLNAVDEYHKKSMLMEKHVIEKKQYQGSVEKAVDDDLIYNVPIYDMGSRKYAAFCNFTQAVFLKQEDVKGYGNHFRHVRLDNESAIYLLYLFRLCGSGINYKPVERKSDLFQPSFIGKHGFGNFWIVNELLQGRCTISEWHNSLKNNSAPFSNNKGYIIPQFKQGLKSWILEHALDLVRSIINYALIQKRDVYQITDYGNHILKSKGFNRQNFVLTAFAADLAEYYPELVNKNGYMYAGTQATRCIKAIFKKTKKVSEFEYINQVLQFQAKRYNLTPIDCEDSRNCDVVRYFKDYQSKHHIEANGRPYKNNSVLKKLWTKSQYANFLKTI